MLKTIQTKYYKVKEGQTLQQIAEYFSVSPRLLVQANGLSAQPSAGRILEIPEQKGNAYTVREGDVKALLCGSEENFRKKNGTDAFYIGMRVIL